mgnify:CR=1 FL=1
MCICNGGYCIYYVIDVVLDKTIFGVEKANNFNEAIKKISSKEKKIIVCFGSLYNVGNILNKN